MTPEPVRPGVDRLGVAALAVVLVSLALAGTSLVVADPTRFSLSATSVVPAMVTAAAVAGLTLAMPQRRGLRGRWAAKAAVALVGLVVLAAAVWLLVALESTRNFA